jgi:hypothetical protein
VYVTEILSNKNFLIHLMKMYLYMNYI